MFLRSHPFTGSSLVTDIVTQDYRTAEVFRRHGIEYCCGGKWPLELVCRANNIDLKKLIRELEEATRNVQLPNSLPFNEWDIDFLTDYIIHVHHHYLKNQLPETKKMLLQFVGEHREKYKFLAELESVFLQFYKDIFPHLEQEEEIIFPYIRQVSHAFRSREPYASLLVKTMRKPIEEIMIREHKMVGATLQKMRELSDDYTAPVRACTSHKVTFHRLRELDNELAQHMHLENNILFPRVINMEKILLGKKDE